MGENTLVGAHPWVYAARQEGYDIYPILEQIFADMSAAGMECVELMHTAFRHAGSVETIRDLSSRYSLPVIGTSFGGSMWKWEEHDAILEDARSVISRLAEVGGRKLGTSVGGAPAPKTPDQLDAQAKLLEKLIALCNENGIVLNLHNHTYEVENNEHDLNGTLARIPEVKLGPDLNWLVRGGVDPVGFIQRHSDRIVFIHLRDQKSDGKWTEAMGEGDMDHGAIARALEEANFSGEAVIELAHESGFELTRPLRESLRISREFVRDEMGY